MTQENWEEINTHHLTVSITWVRTLLLAGLARAGIEVDEAQAEAIGQLDTIANEKNNLELLETRPAITILRDLFGLSAFEEGILLLCVALEMEPSIGRLCGLLQGSEQRGYPTFGLALSIFPQANWDALSPSRPLRYWRLIHVLQQDSDPLTVSSLRLDERILGYVKGVNYVDDRLRPYLLPLNTPQEFILPPSQQRKIDEAVHYLNSANFGQQPPLIQLTGIDSESKKLVAQRVSEALGLQLYTLPPYLLPTQPRDLEDFVRLWERERLLLPLALHINIHDLDPEAPQDHLVERLYRFLHRCYGLIFLDTRDSWETLGRHDIILDVSKPTSEEQAAAWADGLPDEQKHVAGILSGQFNLNIGAIQQLQSDNDNADDLWQACLQHTRPQMDMLAQRIIPKATWDDIVLPDHQIELLHNVAAQVKVRDVVYDQWGFRKRSSRGLGITVLFSGESGTGKTMAAEILANHLQLNLYRIDLSSVVSKYIGETEKNLRRLFDAAEDGGAILFFDEADSLFGKRSDVRDSHDRYANIEVNYLLQRMEAYQGLAILATNLKSGLDDAFMRRLRFSLSFPVPDQEHREKIWRKAFPDEMPKDKLDYEYLGQRFKLAGGNIYNVALNASFASAVADVPLNMKHVLDAVRSELLKQDRLLNQRDFMWDKW